MVGWETASQSGLAMLGGTENFYRASRSVASYPGGLGHSHWAQSPAPQGSSMCWVGWYYIKFPELSLPEVGELNLQNREELLSLKASLHFSSTRSIRSIDLVKPSLGTTMLKICNSWSKDKFRLVLFFFF